MVSVAAGGASRGSAADGRVRPQRPLGGGVIHRHIRQHSGEEAPEPSSGSCGCGSATQVRRRGAERIIQQRHPGVWGRMGSGGGEKRGACSEKE